VQISSLIAAIVGVVLGGLINWLADELPHYRVPQRPQYPDGNPRPPIAYWGITAFILGGRSPKENPSARLSWRYPLTEIATGILFYIVTQHMIERTDYFTVWQMGFWWFYTAALVLIFVIDVEHRLILFSVMIPCGVIAVVDALLYPSFAPMRPNIVGALLGGALGFGVFFLFYLGGFLYNRISAELRGYSFNEVAFGYGDVMLVTFSGLILGWQSLIFAMFITVFLGAFGALVYIIGRKVGGQSAGLTTPLPYGPYIVIGTLWMMIYRQALVSIFY
jgi:leader peptidase (prepilin peptidase)/N-methyltransferase